MFLHGDEYSFLHGDDIKRVKMPTKLKLSSVAQVTDVMKNNNIHIFSLVFFVAYYNTQTVSINCILFSSYPLYIQLDMWFFFVVYNNDDGGMCMWLQFNDNLVQEYEYAILAVLCCFLY